MIDGKCSDWVDVESSVPQGTVAGPMDFLVFIKLSDGRRHFSHLRKQCVVIDGKCSDWVDVESSVPQGTVTGPVDFLVFINDLPQNLTSSIKLFASDCIVFRKIAGSEEAGMLQKDLMLSPLGSQNGK